MRLLTGRLPANTPRSKRLLTDEGRYFLVVGLCILTKAFLYVRLFKSFAFVNGLSTSLKIFQTILIHTNTNFAWLIFIYTFYVLYISESSTCFIRFYLLLLLCRSLSFLFDIMDQVYFIVKFWI